MDNDVHTKQPQQTNNTAYQTTAIKQPTEASQPTTSGCGNLVSVDRDHSGRLKAKRTRMFRIGNYVILADRMLWLWFPDFGSDDGGINRFAGHVRVDRELDVTWLSSWKERDKAPECFKTIQDVEAGLAELSAWNETRWACKLVDFGDEFLIDCSTGKRDCESPEAKAVLRRIRERFEPAGETPNEPLTELTQEEPQQLHLWDI
jgi:hypothetical protein